MSKKKNYVVERFVGEDKQHYFRIVHANKNIIVTSEGYKRPSTRTRVAKNLAGELGIKLAD